MDMLFQRYACPYLLLDEVIEEKRFVEFINEFAIVKRESEIEKVWLHKVFDKTYNDFKNSLTFNDKPSKTSLEAAVKNSKQILEKFIPT